MLPVHPIRKLETSRCPVLGMLILTVGSELDFLQLPGASLIKFSISLLARGFIIH